MNNSDAPSGAPHGASADFPPDSINRPWNPALWRAENGKPKLDKFGRFISIKNGRPPGVKTTPAQTSAPTVAPSQPAAEKVDFSDVERIARAASGVLGNSEASPALPENPTAETVMGLIQTVLVLIGDEEGLLSEMEKQLVRRPLERVLEKYNIGKDILPAEVDLVLAVLGLLAVRLQKPKTATFWEKAKAWAVNAWFSRKGHSTARELRREVGPTVQPQPSP